jgi:hypothetical protein
VNQHLNLGAEAAHRSLVHAPAACEPFARRPFLAIVHLIDTSAIRNERDRMNVDLASARIDKHEAPRRSSGDQGISETVQQLDDPARMPKLDDEVEVVVFPCLTPEQCVDTPAAVEPNIDSVSLYPADDGQQCL